MWIKCKSIVSRVPTNWSAGTLVHLSCSVPNLQSLSFIHTYLGVKQFILPCMWQCKDVPHTSYAYFTQLVHTSRGGEVMMIIILQLYCSRRVITRRAQWKHYFTTASINVQEMFLEIVHGFPVQPNNLWCIPNFLTT